MLTAIVVEDSITLHGGATSGSSHKQITNGNWAKVYAHCQIVGGATWAAGKQGDIVPDAVRVGSMVVMGPITLRPGDNAAVSITGAVANAVADIKYQGYFTDDGTGSELGTILDTPETDGSLQSVVSLVGGSVTVAGTVGTTDAGLAGSIAQRLSQFTPLVTANLTNGATVTVNLGSGTANPYPDQAASWQLVITGLQGVNFGCRVTWEKQDGSGNTFGYTQRDTSQITMDRIIASGILDAPTMIFKITLPGGAPSGCIAYFYTTALLIQDNWYDSGIYENTSSQAGLFAPGYDGILATVGNVIGAGGNQTYQLPTYRGPAQLGVQMTQAGHMIIQEQTYLAAGVSSNVNIPVSASGLSQQIFIVFLGAMNNKLVVFNDSGTLTNTINMELRAIKDLLD